MRSREDPGGKGREGSEATQQTGPDIDISAQAGGSHDPPGHNQRAQDEPADDKRHHDPQHARTQEFAGALAMKGQMTKKAGEQEERFHAERVADRHEHRHQRAGRDVLHRPPGPGPREARR